MDVRRTDVDLNEPLIVLTSHGDAPFFTPDQRADYDLPVMPFDVAALFFAPGMRTPHRHLEITLYTAAAALSDWENFLTPPVVPAEWPLVELDDLVTIRNAGAGRMLMAELAGADGQDVALEDGAEGAPVDASWLLLVEGDRITPERAMHSVRSALRDHSPRALEGYRVVWDMPPPSGEILQSMAEVEWRVRGAYGAHSAEQFIAVRDEAERIHFDEIRPDEQRRAGQAHLTASRRSVQWRVDFQATLLEERAYAAATGCVPDNPWVEGSVGPYLSRDEVYAQIEEPRSFLQELAELERFRPHFPELPIEAASTFMKELVDDVERFDPTRDIGNERSW